jgi:hypothetical protein
VLYVGKQVALNTIGETGYRAISVPFIQGVSFWILPLHFKSFLIALCIPKGTLCCFGTETLKVLDRIYTSTGHTCAFDSVLIISF